jgi:uncharacterized protein (TIGR03067 family)
MRLGFLATVMGVLLAAGVPADAADAKEAGGGIRGTWTAMAAERNGAPADDIKGHRLTLQGKRFTIRSKGKIVYRGTFRLDPSTTPATIDFTNTSGEAKGKVWQGIYSLEGDGLKICDNADDTAKPRPATFATEPGSGKVLVVFTRAAP